MGTRADFYIGRGKDADWIGSIAWDGYPRGIPDEILGSKDAQAFHDLVGDFLDSRADATHPRDGWPWPWNDSQTTDYAYTFDGGQVWACRSGYWFKADEPELPEKEWDGTQKAQFPDMSAIKNVRFDEGSGLIILGVS